MYVFFNYQVNLYFELFKVSNYVSNVALGSYLLVSMQPFNEYLISHNFY
jgi:hypothetical protein